MKLKCLKPFVPGGANFKASRSFFLDLGFVINWEMDGLVEFARDDVVFLLQDFENQQLQENLMMYVEVDDLDACWQRIQESKVLENYEGVRSTGPKDFPWGEREIHLVDPAGVCWHFN